MRAIPFLRAFPVILLSSVTFLLCITPAGAMARPATSYQFTVNTTLDRHDANWGDGICADQQGQCSLRAATEEADALPYGSNVTIVVPAGTYQLVKGTLRLSANRSITINGTSTKTTILEGNQTFRIISIGSPNLVVQLSQLTIEKGNAVGNNSGGGIENYGTLMVSTSIISNNTASSGGGIENYGTLMVSNSTISGNSASDDGGGIDIFDNGTLTMSNSTISGNSASMGGGGITNLGTLTVNNTTIRGNSVATPGFEGGGGIDNWGMQTVNNSTIRGNSSDYEGGGGIANWGTQTGSVVSNSTISNNTTAGSGGGILNLSPYDDFTLAVSNSTISGNAAYYQSGGNIYTNFMATALTGTIVANGMGFPNCSGTIMDMGYNLDSDGSCGLALSTDLNKVDPLLGPLQNNGGPTQTMALLQGSPAINWVNTLTDCPATDQRGDVRPDNHESACDIGAYESAY